MLYEGRKALIGSFTETLPNQPFQPTTKSSGDTQAVHGG